MIVPPACLSCGFPIGDVAPIYWEIQAKASGEKLRQAKTTPGKATENFALSTDNTRLFEKLGIKHDCCRMHIAFAMRLPNHI